MEIAQRLKVVLNALGIVADERGEIVAPSDVNQRVLAALSSLVESILVDRDWQG
jgi:hypothetical protein